MPPSSRRRGGVDRELAVRALDEHDAVDGLRTLLRLPALAHIVEDTRGLPILGRAVASAAGVDAAEELALLDDHLPDVAEPRLAAGAVDLPGLAAVPVVTAEHAARRMPLPVGSEDDGHRVEPRAVDDLERRGAAMPSGAAEPGGHAHRTNV